MRIALIADIHNNLPALEAVLRAIKAHSPDLVISLGDQVNLGPCPKETLSLLRAQNVTCLHGNHERYILSAMAGDPGYQGANFAAVRFQAQQLRPEEITFAKTLELEGAVFCHALPDDDRFPVFDSEKAIPLLEQRTFDRPTRIFCGHGHNPTHIAMHNLTIDSIGSVGCMDDGVPGTAPYAILTLERGYAFLRPYAVSYDASVIPGLFLKSGLAQACPIMSHIISLQMMNNFDFLLSFVGRAEAIRKARGEALITESIWQETDAAFPWPDGVGTNDFWKKHA
ncbi:MAG: metallophosphoesterase family protein [Clostridia bacterium]|nr:metallophosphoesterase family protein [Clostridia bacterium]